MIGKKVISKEKEMPVWHFCMSGHMLLLHFLQYNHKYLKSGFVYANVVFNDSGGKIYSHNSVTGSHLKNNFLKTAVKVEIFENAQALSSWNHRKHTSTPHAHHGQTDQFLYRLTSRWTIRAMVFCGLSMISWSLVDLKVIDRWESKKSNVVVCLYKCRHSRHSLLFVAFCSLWPCVCFHSKVK